MHVRVFMTQKGQLAKLLERSLEEWASVAYFWSATLYIVFLPTDRFCACVLAKLLPLSQGILCTCHRDPPKLWNKLCRHLFIRFSHSAPNVDSHRTYDILAKSSLSKCVLPCSTKNDLLPTAIVVFLVKTCSLLSCTTVIRTLFLTLGAHNRGRQWYALRIQEVGLY